MPASRSSSVQRSARSSPARAPDDISVTMNGYRCGSSDALQAVRRRLRSASVSSRSRWLFSVRRGMRAGLVLIHSHAIAAVRTALIAFRRRLIVDGAIVPPSLDFALRSLSRASKKSDRRSDDIRRSPSCFDHQASMFFCFVFRSRPGSSFVAVDRFSERVTTGLDNLALLDRRLDLASPLLSDAPLRKCLGDRCVTRLAHHDGEAAVALADCCHLHLASANSSQKSTTL